MTEIQRTSAVPISTHFSSLASRYDLDLASIVDDALRERILRDVTAVLTPRMQSVLLAARADARRRGHQHVGAEHVYLAILRDHASLPSQLLRESGTRDADIERVEILLNSEGYNKQT
jgi:ATP-dependent Clp protease ATP-binding subunit ClpC